MDRRESGLRSPGGASGGGSFIGWKEKENNEVASEMDSGHMWEPFVPSNVT